MNVVISQEDSFLLIEAINCRCAAIEDSLSYPSLRGDARMSLVHDLARLMLLKDALYDGRDIYENDPPADLITQCENVGLPVGSRRVIDGVPMTKTEMGWVLS